MGQGIRDIPRALVYQISSLYNGIKENPVVWRSAELPLAAGGFEGQLLILTTVSLTPPLPAPLQVQALQKEICADAGLS